MVLVSFTLGFSGSVLTAMFLALVARQMELSSAEKYLLRMVDLSWTSKNIEKQALSLLRNSMSQWRVDYRNQSNLGKFNVEKMEIFHWIPMIPILKCFFIDFPLIIELANALKFICYKIHCQFYYTDLFYPILSIFLPCIFIKLPYRYPLIEISD